MGPEEQTFIAHVLAHNDETQILSILYQAAYSLELWDVFGCGYPFLVTWSLQVLKNGNFIWTIDFSPLSTMMPTRRQQIYPLLKILLLFFY